MKIFCWSCMSNKTHTLTKDSQDKPLNAIQIPVIERWLKLAEKEGRKDDAIKYRKMIEKLESHSGDAKDAAFQEGDKVKVNAGKYNGEAGVFKEHIMVKYSSSMPPKKMALVEVKGTKVKIDLASLNKDSADSEMKKAGESWREEGEWYSTYQCPDCGKKKTQSMGKVWGGGVTKKPPICKCGSKDSDITININVNEEEAVVEVEPTFEEEPEASPNTEGTVYKGYVIKTESDGTFTIFSVGGSRITSAETLELAMNVINGIATDTADPYKPINYKGYEIVRSKYIIGNVEISQNGKGIAGASSIPAAKAKVDELIKIFGDKAK